MKIINVLESTNDNIPTTPAITYSECYAQAYLTDIPQYVEKYGFCKTLAVRREVIHIKHIFTELFVRKTIDIQKFLNKID